GVSVLVSCGASHAARSAAAPMIRVRHEANTWDDCISILQGVEVPGARNLSTPCHASTPRVERAGNDPIAVLSTGAAAGAKLSRHDLHRMSNWRCCDLTASSSCKQQDRPHVVHCRNNRTYWARHSAGSGPEFLAAGQTHA